MIVNIDYHLIDKCNLNCISCGHFSPLARSSKPKSLDLIENDLHLLYQSTDKGTELNTLTLTGGEVTLHPDLDKAILIAVKYFPNKVKVWSNGMNWKKLVDLRDIIINNNVKLCITNYGTSTSSEAISKLSSVFNEFIYVDRVNQGLTIFNNKFFNKDKIVSIDQILRCEPRSYCHQLVDGKIYPCQYLAYIHYLVEYFGDKIKLPIPTDSYIELTEDVHTQDIIQFVKSYVCELCFHCIDCLPDRPVQVWKLSNLKIEEWYG